MLNQNFKRYFPSKCSITNTFQCSTVTLIEDMNIRNSKVTLKPNQMHLTKGIRIRRAADVSVKAWTYGKVNSHHEITSVRRAFCTSSACVHIQNVGQWVCECWRAFLSQRGIPPHWSQSASVLQNQVLESVWCFWAHAQNSSKSECAWKYILVCGDGSVCAWRTMRLLIIDFFMC